MDYETLSNCFVAVFKHYKTDETHIFSICKLQNDYIKFTEFLKQNERVQPRLNVQEKPTLGAIWTNTIKTNTWSDSNR